MKNRFLLPLIFGFVFSIVFSGCNTSGKITKRFKKITYVPNQEIDKYIGVSAYVVLPDAIETAKAKTIFDLTDVAQAELIRQLSIRETENAKLITLLASSLSSKPNNPIEILDLTRFQKRINISVKRTGYKVGDRINMIDINLSLPDVARLLSCNRLTTEYQTLEYGKQTYSNTAGFSLQGTAGSGFSSTLTSGGTNGRTLTNTDVDGYKNDAIGTSSSNTSGNTYTSGNTNGLSSTATGNLGVTGNVNGSRTFAEEAALRERIVGLQVSINNNDLNIFKNGGLGLDLIGNVAVDIAFEVKGSIDTRQIISITELFNPAGESNKPDKIKVKDFLVIFPDYKSDINAKINYSGQYRTIIKGDNTPSESDDTIELLMGDAKKDDRSMTLVRLDELKPKMWGIKIPSPNTMKELRIHNPELSGNGMMVFNSATEAKNFIVWLKSNYSKLSADLKIGATGHRLILPAGAVLNQSSIENIRLFSVND